MLESLAEFIETGVEMSCIWGPFLIFFFMAVESSLIPFPSEVIMIPAGVIIARHGDFWWADPLAFGFFVVVMAGLIGSMAGAYFNYYMSLRLGRPFLHRYGKYFFLPANKLDRAEEIFSEHGEIATFVCRLLPAIRQLISIPAGLARMNILRFSFFTGLGAGIWVVVLTVIGYVLGRASADKTYTELVFEGKDILHDNLVWIGIGVVVLVGVYAWVHHKVMKKS